jgi:hypothetical protein
MLYNLLILNCIICTINRYGKSCVQRLNNEIRLGHFISVNYEPASEIALYNGLLGRPFDFPETGVYLF